MKTVTYDETKWKVVPIEPTVEMLDSVQVKDHDDRWIQVELCADIYSDMLAAAPAPKEES